jgi:hypothetical protein
MTTSGTSAFNLNLIEIVEEAFERTGNEMRTGYDMRTATRSLNLLSMEWANRGINLWTVEQGSIPLVVGQATYDLPLDTIDLSSYMLRTGTGINQTDLVLSRMSLPTYAAIPNKLSQGRPLQLWVDRKSGATVGATVQYPQVVLWPVPEQSNYYTLIYWRLRRMQDAGVGAETQDIPFRFLPAMIAGLALQLARKLPNATDRIPMLELDYEKQWQLASDEDRDKSSLRIVPMYVR